MNTPPESQEARKRSLMSIEALVSFVIAGLLLIAYIIGGLWGDGFYHYYLVGVFISLFIGIYFTKKSSTSPH